jgi:phage terminase large subunit-like protein
MPSRSREALIRKEARKHGMSVIELKALLLSNWAFTGRPKQQPPSGEWLFWFLLAGRGFGKTISAAQWAKSKGVERRMRIALVAPTFADGRDTMVEGETGLLSVIPNLALLGQSREHAWNRSIGELRLANGTVYRIYSSETPNRLRGPNNDAAWCEEVSSWKDAHKHARAENSTWSNVLFSTRLSDLPQYVLTSTPKPNLLTRDLLAMPGMHIVRGLRSRGPGWVGRRSMRS